MGKKKYTVNLIFTVALLGLFALSALFVAVLGAQVYGRTVDQMDENYNTRTSLVYVAEKVKQSPGRDISIKEVDGNQALVLTQDVDGKSYESWIFCSDGKLKEVMVPEGRTVKSIDGQTIMEIKSFDLSIEENLLRVTVLDRSGNEDYVILSLGI